MRTALYGLGLLTIGILSAAPSQASTIRYTLTLLMGTQGDGTSFANAINNAGQVVGNSYPYLSDFSPFPQSHATLWNGTTATNLGTPGGGSFALAINNAGQVAGVQGNHATLWNGTTATDLGTLGGPTSVAYDINDAGKVVGDADINIYRDFHATVWNGTTATDLGTLSGGTRSSALDINNADQIVGYSWTTDASTDPLGIPTTHAILWNGTTMTDLNSLLDLDAVSEGWTVTQATGINDQGWIVGDAIKSGQRVAVLLIPIPEPETYIMFMAGLGLLGFMARHKKSEVRI